MMKLFELKVGCVSIICKFNHERKTNPTIIIQKVKGGKNGCKADLDYPIARLIDLTTS